VGYKVIAHNTSTASANKIHDDDVARQFGFRGGLVPGVDVYAYLCHLPAERWGRDWLQRGTMTARFRSPVYHGEEVDIEGLEDGDGVLELTLRDPAGEVCATARAAVPDALPAVPDPGAWPSGPAPAEPPLASPEVFRAAPFGSIRAGFAVAEAGGYLDDVREHLALFRNGGPAHPGWLLRFANYVLTANVRMGPWVHVESTTQHFGVVEDGEQVETRALVTDVTERSGHRLVDLDVLQLVGVRPVARTAHRAIYQLRGSVPEPASVPGGRP